MSEPDWKSLKDAHGPAAGLPNYLEGLRSSDPGVRASSVSNLAAALYSDDRWFSASGPALSVLLEMAGASGVPARGRCLVLATDILTAGHMRRLATGLDLRDPTLKKRYARGAAKEVYGAARAGAPRVRALLGDDDAFVRAAAALFLAFVFAAARESEGALRARLAVEDDCFVCASILMALGLSARYSDDAKGADDLAPEARDRPAIIRGAAVLARLYRNSSAPEGDAWRDLVDMVRLGDVGLDRFPWAYGRVDHLTSMLVESLVPNGRRVVARLLGDAIVAAGPGEPMTEAWGSGALQLGFEQTNDLLDASSLSAEQRAIAGALSTHSLKLPFTSYGIPSSVRDRRRWLGLDPPGPLDATAKIDGDPESEGQPLWRVIRRLQRSKVSDDALFDRLRASLPAEQLAAVYGEVDVEGYGTRRPAADKLSEALRPLGDKAVDWAERVADHLLNGIALGELRAGPPLGNTVVRQIVKSLPEGAILDERYDTLISPAGKDLIEALPPPRRERALTRFLEDPVSYPQAERFKLSLVVPVLGLCPTKAVAAGVLQLCKTILGNRYPIFEDEEMARKALQTLESLRAEPGVSEALQEKQG